MGFACVPQRQKDTLQKFPPMDFSVQKKLENWRLCVDTGFEGHRFVDTLLETLEKFI